MGGLPILQPLPRAGSPDADAALDRMSARIGYRPNALATMAHRPRALIAVLSLAEQAVFEPGASPLGLRWLAAYATCVGAGCGYSGTHAAHGAMEAGEALPRVVAAAYAPGGGGFGPSERALLEMAGAIGRTGDGSSFAEAAREQAGVAVLAEITLVCAAFGLFNRWNRTMRTELEPDLQDFADQLSAEIRRSPGG